MATRLFMKSYNTDFYLFGNIFWPVLMHQSNQCLSQGKPNTIISRTIQLRYAKKLLLKKY